MTNQWHGLKAGDRIITLVETMGDTTDDETVVYAAGSYATVDAVRNFGAAQGWGVDITIGESGRAISNSFDDRDIEDLGFFPFELVAEGK